MYSIHLPSCAHSIPEDSFRYLERLVGPAEEGQGEVIRPFVEDVPVKPLVGILALEVDDPADLGCNSIDIWNLRLEFGRKLRRG